MQLADVIGRNVRSVSTPTVTDFRGADAHDADVFGSPGRWVDLNTFGDNIAQSLSGLNLLRPVRGDKQAGTDGQNRGPQPPPGGLTKLTPTLLTDGVKLTPPTPGSAKANNPTGGPSAKTGAKVHDSLQQVAENVDKTVHNVTDSVGRVGVPPYPAELSDCAAAVRWAVENRQDHLCVGQLIAWGESSGDNLSLTVAHEANRQGWGREITGVSPGGTDAVEPAVRARPRQRPMGGCARRLCPPGSRRDPSPTSRWSVSPGRSDRSVPPARGYDASLATTYLGSRPKLMEVLEKRRSQVNSPLRCAGNLRFRELQPMVDDLHATTCARSMNSPATATRS